MKNLQGWMILGIACLAGCVGTTIPVQAQQTATTIVVKERLVEHVGDRLIIDMKLALDELSLPANRSLVCTPLIERGDSVRALPPVIVNGRNRQIQYDRSGRDAAANGEFVLRRYNGKEQTFDYHASIPFAKWMERSEGNSGGEGDGNHAYMNVRISTVADGPMTKADPSSPNGDGSGWGEDGNGWLGELPGKNEGMVYNVNIFLFETNANTLSKADHLDFLNGEENPTVAGYGYYDVKTGDSSGLDASEGGSEPNHGSRNIRITMNSDLDENPKNYQVFAIVNAGTDLKTKIKSLKELRDYVAEGNVIAKNGTDVANANEFLMSTHKMVSDATPANFPSIVSLSSQNTAENPAKTAVYVERLAARIDLTYKTPVEGKVALDFDNESSPVNKQGTFHLTGYTLINQWQGNTKMFKQVSPTVDSYEKDLEMNDQYKEGDPLQYLGDEIWQWDPASKPNGSFNFVLSESFNEKTLADVANDKWEKLYRNYFNEGLNDVNKVTAIPLNNPPVSYEDPVNNKTYYPISYVRENTLNTSAQVHGYSTGVIFRTKFTPNEDFKMTEYVNGAIFDKAQLDDTENFVFLTAEHFNGKEAQKLVYKNIKTVAARAFNIPDGTDKTNLLKGIMEGWTDDVTSTLADVKTAIEGMSIKNKLEEKFKKYLEDQLSTATDLTPDLKNRLTYKGFVST